MGKMLDFSLAKGVLDQEEELEKARQLQAEENWRKAEQDRLFSAALTPEELLPVLQSLSGEIYTTAAATICILAGVDPEEIIRRRRVKEIT